MLWPSKALKVASVFLVLVVNLPDSYSEGNVGCLFSERLCLEEEWCYDDLAFGRCLGSVGDIDEDDLFRYNLERESLHELSAELRRLFALGYRWSHGYTQCRLQAMLYSFKHDMTFEPDSCLHLSDNDLEGALKALEGQVELDPQEVAIIKYTPSAEDPHGPYADEIYYPTLSKEELRQKILAPNAIDLDLPDPYADYLPVKRTWIPQMKRTSAQPQLHPRMVIPDNRQQRRNVIQYLQEYDNNLPMKQTTKFPQTPLSVEDMRDMYPIIKFLNDLHLTPKQISQLLKPKNYDKLEALIERFNNKQTIEVQDLLRKELEAEKAMDDDEIPSGNFNLRENFRTGWNDFPEPRIYYDENEEDHETSEYGSGYPEHSEIFRERQMENSDSYDGISDTERSPKVYSEGGVVWSEPVDLKDDNPQDRIFENDLNKLLQKYNLAFKRPERLDVKKPGPPFDNLIAETTDYKPEYPSHTEPAAVILPSMMKKEPRNIHPHSDKEKSNRYNLDYVYVTFKNRLSSWRQGENIIRNISNIMKLDSRVFADGRTLAYSVSFKVLPNSRGLNINQVVRQIEAIKDKVNEMAGVEIISIGIGNKDNEVETIVSLAYDQSQFYIIIFLVCGILGALIIASALLIFIRRHVKLREKLQGLSKPDTEASKDYQDLCRARMATKGQTATDTVHGRITSLSKESEQSPSSRSSTSSWSEEPALHNMDISTGHMVLSYMEDHLKNKDRLEQEWVALCAYIAEPCEMTVATKKDNKEKNRYQEVVPYDHARVVLNELTNANASDYINASSITDHDPRNPAYIATQGPLPLTAPDFWQLIWEQGAVVIVMLTRLTEGGNAMCHRYWPEEGSELYHIYEVHLVSEHIWCDDYLVRSFYLKNIRTGETRTVTQFHFLSWPESGIPASTKALLEFRRKVNKSYRGRSCPIVVHCSDGAGRTGTYCLIDMVLSRMAKGAKEIDIAATLEHLRDQRPKMVATKQQFEFVLTAVAEEVHAILKALPPQPNPASIPEKEK
ncbi:receptor-type tyrosine-protein phosphatase N2 [Diorhabda carinulata]|uniref:receptor-type tyrosine-protein phosphatase N2 n=1 Tax=Diorhabda carinulata TaxID=1163345 RepID=UPI0025A13268|nr:receptor-type tyrosine-protein phosphatase N2 [Diorhabda carinulata]